MLKQALDTYWHAVMPKNWKRLKDKTYRMILLILFIVIPILTTGISENINNLYILTKFMPLVLLEVSNLDGTMHLPKAMYLTPMQQEDRRKYVDALLVIKIGIVAGLAVFLDLLWGIAYGIGLNDVILNIIIYTSIGISVCVREFRVKLYLDWNLANLCIGLCLILGFVPGSNGQNAGYFLEIHPNIWFVLIFMLMIDYKILKNKYKKMLQAVSNYEIAHFKKGCQLADVNNYENCDTGTRNISDI